MFHYFLVAVEKLLCTYPDIYIYIYIHVYSYYDILYIMQIIFPRYIYLILSVMDTIFEHHVLFISLSVLLHVDKRLSNQRHRTGMAMHVC